MFKSSVLNGGQMSLICTGGTMAWVAQGRAAFRRLALLSSKPDAMSKSLSARHNPAFGHRARFFLGGWGGQFSSHIVNSGNEC